MTPADFEDVHQQLQRLLREHTEEYLKQCYCVVEPHRYRLRSLTSALNQDNVIVRSYDHPDRLGGELDEC